MSIDPLDLPQDKNLKDDHVLPLIEPLDKISNDVNILNSLNAFSLPREKLAKADNILIYVDPLTVPQDEVFNNSIGTNFDDDHMPRDRDCSTYHSNPKTRGMPTITKAPSMGTLVSSSTKKTMTTHVKIGNPLPMYQRFLPPVFLVLERCISKSPL